MSRIRRITVATCHAAAGLLKPRPASAVGLCAQNGHSAYASPSEPPPTRADHVARRMPSGVVVCTQNLCPRHASSGGGGGAQKAMHCSSAKYQPSATSDGRRCLRNDSIERLVTCRHEPCTCTLSKSTHDSLSRKLADENPTLGMRPPVGWKVRSCVAPPARRPSARARKTTSCSWPSSPRSPRPMSPPTAHIKLARPRHRPASHRPKASHSGAAAFTW